ncbi:phage tail fiber protein, partial [Citrobacter freundii]
DGSSYSGPAWGGITETLNLKADKTSLDEKADKNSLGTAAGKNTGTTADDVMQPGMFGIGLKTGASAFNTTNFADIQAGMLGKGASVFRNNNIFVDDPSIYQYSPCLWLGAGDTWASVSFPYEPRGQVAIASGSESAGRLGVRLLWCNASTTVDSGGFIKKASPIVKIYADGHAEVNDESEGVTVERLNTGTYLVVGCMGLNSDAAWGGIDGGFEIPVDRNKQPRIWLDYKVNPDGSILVRTYHRVHESSPSFAQNRIGTTDVTGVFTEAIADREPVDIPADSFVSVRVEMPEDSIWNLKRKETQEAQEKAERERQQNQQGAQS